MSRVVFALVLVFVLLLRLGADGQNDVCTQDFSIVYSQGPVFTLGAANSTCICPYFRGNGTHLTDLNRAATVQSLEARLSAGLARLAALEVRFNATNGTLPAPGPAGNGYAAANTNCLQNSDCPSGMLCSPYWFRCRVSVGGACNLTQQCMDGMYCTAGKTCSNVLASCAEVQSRLLPQPSDGPYTVTVASQATPVWCDMTTSGGGWNLVLNINPTDGNVLHHDNTAFWLSNSAGSTGGARTNATFALLFDYKNVNLFTNFVASQVLIFVHNQGSQKYYRAWTVTTPATVYSWFNRADGAQFKITNGFVNSSIPYDTFANDPVVSPAAEHLYANTQTSNQNNDFNRLSRNPDQTGDNCGWGLGTKYDTNWTPYSRPWADAIAKLCGTWTNGFIGTDIMPGNGYGSASGYSYSYAIYVR